MRRISPIVLVACALAGAWGLTGAFAGGSSHVPTPDFPIGGSKGTYLRECAEPEGPEAKLVLHPRAPGRRREVGRPGEQLPRIDRKVRTGGGFLAGNCHVFMHEVGRTWARRHGVTLETMFRYVPKSNDPGCSAGFGMGMVMHLGTQLILEPRKVIPSCTAAAHALSPVHVLPRLRPCVHARLSQPASERDHRLQVARRALHPGLRPGRVPRLLDLAQRRRRTPSGRSGADTNPRSVCASYAFPRPCWYRFFWERKQSASVADEGDLRRLCRGVAGAQRAGCIGGASLLLARGGDPVYHARICGRLSGNDALNCLRGVNVPALAGNRYEQIRLLRTCTGQPKSTRNGCYGWFGRTLNVVTNGRFERSGCGS